MCNQGNMQSDLPKIIKWDMVNVVNVNWEVPMCSGLKQKKSGGGQCDKKAKFEYISTSKHTAADGTQTVNQTSAFYCQTHAPKLGSPKKGDLASIPACGKCGKPSKATIGDETWCGRHIPKNTAYALHPVIKRKPVKKKLVNDISYQDLTVRIINILEEHRADFLDCDFVCLELQLNMNARIKFISHIIYTWFVKESLMSGHGKLKGIRNMLANSKFDCYTGPAINSSHIKDEKMRRKYESVEMVRWMLQNSGDTVALSKLDAYTERGIKLDDLTDAYIQGVSALAKTEKPEQYGSQTIKMASFDIGALHLPFCILEIKASDIVPKKAAKTTKKAKRDEAASDKSKRSVLKSIKRITKNNKKPETK